MSYGKQLWIGLMLGVMGLAAAPAAATSFSLSSPGPLGVEVGFACAAGTLACSGAPELSLVSTADLTGTFVVSASGIATGALSFTASDDIVP